MAGTAALRATTECAEKKQRGHRGKAHGRESCAALDEEPVVTFEGLLAEADECQASALEDEHRAALLIARANASMARATMIRQELEAMKNRVR